MTAIDSLYDDVERSLDPRVYVDAELYRLETERVFSRSWLFLAHASQLATPGAFVTTTMGEDPVIVARQPDGSIAAFLNVCRHRGMRLCRADAGEASSHTCSYHGWTYDTCGRLLAVPMADDLFAPPIDKEAWSAERVPRIEEFHGFIFGSWDAHAPPFTETIADLRPYFDAIFDAGEGMEVMGGIEKWSMRANWKLAADQYVSDDWHFLFTHASGFASTLEAHPYLAARIGAPGPGEARHARSHYGHGIGFSTHAAWHAMRQEISLGPEVARFLEGEHREAGVRRHGEVMGKEFGLTHGLLFPNFGFVSLGMFRVMQPRGPDRTEIWDYVMVPKNASDSEKQAWRRTALHTFGAAGIFEQEDQEHWTAIQRALRGTRARKNRLNFQMGLGQERDPSGRFPGMTDAAVSEEGSRNFYRRWTQLMSEAR